MANNENLVQYSGRSRKEVEEINRKGGQASGKARRRKAEFRKTLNALLTAEIDNQEWKPFLESIGLDCTLESAMLAAQIREAMQGNTKAAYFVAQYAGQNGAAEEDIRNKEADTELKKIGQYAFEKCWPRLCFRDIFGKNYLDDDEHPKPEKRYKDDLSGFKRLE